MEYDRKAQYGRPVITSPLMCFCVPDRLLFPNCPADADLMDRIYCEIRKAGLSVLSSPYFLAAARHMESLSSSQGMPYIDCYSERVPKNVIDAQRQYVSDLFSGLSVIADSDRLRYLYGGRDITEAVEAIVLGSPDILLRMRSNPAWLSGIRNYVQQLYPSGKIDPPIGFVDSEIKNILGEVITPTLHIVRELPGSSIPLPSGTIFSFHESRKADRVVKGDHDITQAIRELDTHFEELRELRDELRARVARGDVRFRPQFDRSQWPRHPLMDILKTRVAEIVDEELGRMGCWCDRQDAIYQTLFRATTYPVGEIYEYGDKIEDRLRVNGAYDDWEAIPRLNTSGIDLTLNEKLIRDIVKEQLSVIQYRLESTFLPIEMFVRRSGIFSEAGWQLKKRGGSVVCVNKDTREGDMGVTFKPVDPNLANEIHRVFHYIHTPRSKIAYGLYLQDAEFPFSVVGFDFIDRKYKQEVLLMSGYDPWKCLDLTRLYSRPGSPFNTSSTIFSLAFEVLRQHGIQAVLSSFMPTYANGMSMISAGFNDGSLIKPGTHTFGKSIIHGEEAWEHVTRRRLEGFAETIVSRWPLLPVLELLAPLCESPRFKPFDEIKGNMMVVDC